MSRIGSADGIMWKCLIRDAPNIGVREICPPARAWKELISLDLHVKPGIGAGIAKSSVTPRVLSGRKIHRVLGTRVSYVVTSTRSAGAKLQNNRLCHYPLRDRY